MSRHGLTSRRPLGCLSADGRGLSRARARGVPNGRRRSALSIPGSLPQPCRRCWIGSAAVRSSPRPPSVGRSRRASTSRTRRGGRIGRGSVAARCARDARLHVGQHGDAEGRAPHARQPRRECARLRRVLRARTGRPLAARSPALPRRRARGPRPLRARRGRRRAPRARRSGRRDDRGAWRHARLVRRDATPSHRAVAAGPKHSRG